MESNQIWSNCKSDQTATATLPVVTGSCYKDDALKMRQSLVEYFNSEEAKMIVGKRYA